MDSLFEDVFRDLFTTRYITVSSLVFLVYDHIQTLDIEFKNVWTNKSHKNWYKLSFVLNRYLTEAVVSYVVYIFSGHATDLNDVIDCECIVNSACRCQRFVWVFTITATVVIAVSQFFINLRVYQTWETRKHMAVILIGGFSILIAGAAVLAVLVAIDVQPLTHYIPLVHTCAFFDIPIKLPILLGVLAFFDLFLIILAIFNALERPHQTNSEVIDSLHIDGAKLFMILFGLRLASMVVSIIGSAAECFSGMCFVFALNSVIVSRMHLRLEGLRFLTFGFGKSFLDF